MDEVLRESGECGVDRWRLKLLPMLKNERLNRATSDVLEDIEALVLLI